MGKVYEVQGKKGSSWGIDYYAEGRRIRRVIGPQKKAAERELKKAEGLAASGQGGGPWGSRKIRFRDFADEYFEHQVAHVKPTSVKRYTVVLKVLKYAFGDVFLTAIRRHDVERYMAARAKAVTSTWTVIGEVGVLKQMLKLAVEWGYLWRNPAQDVKKPRGHYRTRHLSEPEMHLLLAFCHPKARPIVALAFFTGMRQGELLGLTWDHVNLERRRVFLPDTKANEAQTVHLSDSAVAEFEAIPRRRKDPRVFRMHPRTLNHHFRKACTAAGIPDFRFHDCRHTFCSRLVELGANLRAVQALARHKQISMTMRYAHLRDDYLGETVQLLNNGAREHSPSGPSNPPRPAEAPVDRNPVRNPASRDEKG